MTAHTKITTHDLMDYTLKQVFQCCYFIGCQSRRYYREQFKGQTSKVLEILSNYSIKEVAFLSFTLGYAKVSEVYVPHKEFEKHFSIQILRPFEKLITFTKEFRLIEWEEDVCKGLIQHEQESFEDFVKNNICVQSY